MSKTSCGHPACKPDADHPINILNRDLLAALEQMVSLNEDYRFKEGRIYSCVYCGRGGAGRDRHHDNCPVLAARAAIARAKEA